MNLGVYKRTCSKCHQTKPIAKGSIRNRVLTCGDCGGNRHAIRDQKREVPAGTAQAQEGG